MQEDIPVLTEVHVKSAQSIKSINITADLIAEIIAQIQPRLKLQLEEEIESSVTDSVLEKFKNRMHDDLLNESAQVQKTSQDFLADALKEQFEQQSQRLDYLANATLKSTSDELFEHINEQLQASQQASHASLMDAIHNAISQAQQSSVEQIKASLALEVKHALADAQQTILDNSAVYVDKIKADLTTDIPKLMQANAQIINADLSNTLTQMQDRALNELQANINQALPMLEQNANKQFETKLATLENDALENAAQSLQVRANLAKADLENALAQIHAQGILEVQARLAAALPTMEQGLTNQLQETLKSLENTTLEQANQAATRVKAELEVSLVNMQAQGIAEVQAKLIGALPMLHDSLKENLEFTLLGLESKTVEDASHALQDKITRLHQDILTEHQNNLSGELFTIYQGLTAESQVELATYLNALQLTSKQQLDLEVSEAFPEQYQKLTSALTTSLKQDLDEMADTSKHNFLESLNAQLPEVQQVLTNKVQEILNVEVPRIEQQVSANIKTEIEKLLDSVRLIFSK